MFDNALLASAQDARKENARLRATLLNIQAMAERGNPIDTAKLAEQCHQSLNSKSG